MKTLLLSLFLILPFAMKAQPTNSVVQKQSLKYCRIYIIESRKKVTIRSDYGAGFEKEINGKGQELEFKSETDVLNYMAALRWEFVMGSERKSIDSLFCYVFKRLE